MKILTIFVVAGSIQEGNGFITTGSTIFLTEDEAVKQILDWDDNTTVADIEISTAIRELEEAGGVILPGLMPNNNFLFYKTRKAVGIIPNSLNK